MSNSSPELSVVVIGRNEEERLGACLASVIEHAGDLGPEILYVDAGSDDASREIAAAHAEVRAIALPPANAAAARNAGWRAARAERVLFLDGDMILAPGFLEEARAALDVPGVAAVAGFIIEEMEGANLPSRVFGADWSRAVGAVEAVGGAALWRRASLVATDGFDEALRVGEDPDLSHRVRARGETLIQIETPMVSHRLGLRGWGDWWRRGVSVGLSSALIARLHGPRSGAHRRLRGARRVVGVAALTLVLAIVCFVTFDALVALGLGAVAGIIGFAFLGRRLRRARRETRAFGPALAHALHEQLVKVPLLVGMTRASFISLDHRSRS